MKRLKFLVCFLLVMCIFCSSVYADDDGATGVLPGIGNSAIAGNSESKSLTCLYGKKGSNLATKLVQTSTGDKIVYLHSSESKPDIDDNGWYIPTNFKITTVFDKTNLYDDGDKVLTGCPSYLNITKSNGYYLYYFRDKKKTFATNLERYYPSDDSSSKDDSEATNNVQAQDLHCIYNTSSWKREVNAGTSYMLVQEKNGNKSMYVHFESYEPLFGDPNWYYIDYNRIKFNFDDKTNYTGNFSACPSYLESDFSYYSNSSLGSKFNFSFYTNEKKDYVLLDSDSDLIYKNDFKQIFFSDVNYNADKKLDNTTWLGICKYSSVTLYFNRDEMILVNSQTNVRQSTSRFSLNSWLNSEYYTSFEMCPMTLYQHVDSVNYSGQSYVSYYLESATNRIPLALEDYDYVDDDSDEPQDVVIENCSDLFSENFIEEINSYLLIVKILVPIILLVTGVLDFAKAIFSSSEDEMKKAQSKFIKRIIAAVVVFLVPTFVNLLLEIANGVWSYIDPNTCGIGW